MKKLRLKFVTKLNTKRLKMALSNMRGEREREREEKSNHIQNEPSSFQRRVDEIKERSLIPNGVQRTVGSGC